MARPAGEKTRCNAEWTEARFLSFIKGNLRLATRKWAPISQTLKDAKVRRGIYLCAHCEQEVPTSIKVDGKRVKNVRVDHINPVVDPDIGWTNFDDYINRLFCETDNLQVLCNTCHDIKTNDEKARAKVRREKEKYNAKE